MCSKVTNRWHEIPALETFGTNNLALSKCWYNHHYSTPEWKPPQWDDTAKEAARRI